MTINPSEDISACLDAELPPAALSDTLRRIAGDEDLRGLWDRYHLIGDVLRGEGIRPSASGVGDRVRSQLEQEPAIIAAPRRQTPRWVRPAAGAALAASVATAAVIGLPRLNDLDPTSAPLRVAIAPTPINYTEPTSMRWKNLAEPGVASKLNGYLVDHSEYASPGGMSGVLPYASFVSYDSTRP